MSAQRPHNPNAPGIRADKPTIAAPSVGGQVNRLTLSRDGCGRCDGHHKIVDWVEKPARG